MSFETHTINPSDHRSRIMSSPYSPTSPMMKSARSDSNYSSVDSSLQSQTPSEKNAIKTTTSRGSTYSYEELSNGLTCPTCQGTGKIPRGQETDLVALIPYSDKRLRPRRTWLYVFVAVFICILLAGLLCAFLIPRSIEVVQVNVTSENVNLNLTEGKCFMALESVYNITNNNFVSVMTNDISLDVTVTFSQTKILTKKFRVDQKISIRSMEQVVQPFNVTLTDKIFPIQLCRSPQGSSSSLYMKFESTLNFTFMMQTDQRLMTNYFIVSCRPTQHAFDSDIFTLQAIDKRDFPELSEG